MQKKFIDKFHMTCIFLDDGIFFSNSLKDVYYPHGCLDSLNISLLGVMQAVSRAHVCCFTIAKEDRAEIRQLVKQAKEAMKTAPSAEPVVVDKSRKNSGELVDETLPREEQRRLYKSQFVRGVISKPQYDLYRKLLAD